MVAGDHDRGDAGLPAGRHRRLGLGARRIEQPDQAEQGEIALERVGLAVRGRSAPSPAGDGEHPQPVLRHLLGRACHRLVIERLLTGFGGHRYGKAAARSPARP